MVGVTPRTVSVGLCADKRIEPVAGDDRDTAVALNPADDTWPRATPWDQRGQLTAVYSTDSENVSAPTEAKASRAAGCHSGCAFLDSHQGRGRGPGTSG